MKLNKTPHKFYNLNFNYPFIGTLDLETYKINDLSKFYAIGFYPSRYKTDRFYINQDNLDSNKLRMDCFYSMLISKYTCYTFYTHNIGKFDITFILKTLVTQIRQNKDYKL